MIEAKNLYAGYGKKSVLENISLNIKTGEFTSIIGPNGSGKSTLLKSLTGIIKILKGEISIDELSSIEIPRQAKAQKIAYLPQGGITNSMTVEQTVLHGRFPYLSYPRKYSATDKKITHSALERVGIKKELWNEPLDTLSGGMKQTVYIAMALAQSTDYIFLDEPTTYLDISHQINIMNLLKNLAEDGKGIVSVMHDLPLAFKFSDNIIVMNEGRIIANDTPEKLSKTDIINQTFGVGIRLDKETGEYSYFY